MNPTAYDFVPPKVYGWNLGMQHKLPGKVVLDLAYAGSSSKNLLRNTNINAPALGATLAPENQDPTKSAELAARGERLADGLPTALPGLRQHL